MVRRTRLDLGTDCIGVGQGEAAPFSLHILPTASACKILPSFQGLLHTPLLPGSISDLPLNSIAICMSSDAHLLCNDIVSVVAHFVIVICLFVFCFQTGAKLLRVPIFATCAGRQVCCKGHSPGLESYFHHLQAV